MIAKFIVPAIILGVLVTIVLLSLLLLSADEESVRQLTTGHVLAG